MSQQHDQEDFEYAGSFHRRGLGSREGSYNAA